MAFERADALPGKAAATTYNPRPIWDIEGSERIWAGQIGQDWV